MASRSTNEALPLFVVIIGLVVIFLGLFALGAWVIEYIWNTLATYFHFQHITYLIAWIIECAGIVVEGRFHR